MQTSSSFSPSEVSSRIAEILRHLVAGIDVTSMALVDEGYVSSITIVQLVSELDETFGIEIDFMSLKPDDFKSVAAITRLVERSPKTL